MSTSEFFAVLTHSVSLALALIFVYSYIVPYITSYSLATRAVLQGVMFGLFAIVDMTTAARSAGGFVIDGHGVLIAISSLFGGPIAAFMTTMLVCLYRIWLGGVGVLPSVPAAIITAVFGLLFYYRYRYQLPSSRLIPLTLLGIGSATQTLVWFSLLGGETDVSLASGATLVFLIFFPLCTALVGSALFYQIRKLETQQVLSQQQSLLRKLIDLLPDYIFVKDTKLRFIASNLAHAHSVNIANVDKIIGKTAAELFPPDFAASFEADDRQVIETGAELVNAERLTIDATGNKRWVLTTKVPFRDPQGKLAGLVGISRDITERKKAEEILRRSEELYRTIARNFPNGAVILYDHELRCILVDGRGLAELGLSKEQMEGKTVWDVIPPDAAIVDVPQLRAALTGEFISQEVIYKGRIFAIYHMPVNDSDGTVMYGMSMIQNITERKRAEHQALKLEKEHEQVAMLAEFVRNISHDFRTPLTIIGTSTYLLSKVTEPEKQKSYISTIEQQILRLTQLMERQLTMVRLDSQEVFAFQCLDVNLIVSNLVFMVSSEAKTKGIRVVSSLCKSRLMIQADADELGTGLAELGKNAVWYTPPGGTITICTKQEDNQAVIEVCDTGIGIASSELSDIFQRLYRVDAARSSANGGTGLGLAIAKRIIELHHGRIEVESVVGKGSIFRVFLPLSELERVCK